LADDFIDGVVVGELEDVDREVGEGKAEVEKRWYLDQVVLFPTDRRVQPGDDRAISE